MAAAGMKIQAAFLRNRHHIGRSLPILRPGKMSASNMMLTVLSH